MKYNADNERIKRRYLFFLKDASQQSEATVDAVAKALARFEEDTKWRDFRTFRSEQAIAFKTHLAGQKGSRGQPLSKATLYATTAHLKRFFQWLSQEPGYRSHVNRSDAAYFNLSEKETRIATARRAPTVPTIEQLEHVIHCMPSSTDVQLRDRALFAFILLTGTRDRAVASLKLKHIDLAAGRVDHDAREVETKNSKTSITFFFPVDPGIRGIVSDWIEHLRTDKLWGNDDPLFPATKVCQDDSRKFAATGLDRTHWSTAAPIRKVFQEAFARADLPYFNPHSLRSTLARLGEQRCKTPEQFKAWSQNLGHEQVLTTFRSYGHVSIERQGELIEGFRHGEGPKLERDEIARHLETIHAEIRSLKASSV